VIAGTPAASELFCTGRTNRIQDLVGNGQRFGRRGDISNVVVALSATSKSPLDIYCHFSETFSPGVSQKHPVRVYGISVA
jgi:hypothetical protein